MAVRTVAVKLVADIGGYTSQLERASRSTDKLSDSAERTAKQHRAAWDQIGRAGAVAAAVGVVAVGAMVKSFMDFDAAMSQTQAATRATGSELAALRQAALDAGKATVFSATEAAKAETELSKAGVSTSDILGGALTGALDLASAGQLDVADAANIAATAMTQFGLSGKDVPHIADLLAAGAGKAQGEVSDLATALKYVGPVAHQMGISIEETTGVLAEMASQGILADQAGTSLRGMLTALTSPSKIAREEMKQLGINVYDAAGNFVGFDGVAGQLHDKLGKLTNAQRDSALGTIFGNEQITAARVLYAGGAKAVDDWTAKVNDQGFAQEQAAAKLNNLRGDLEQFRGSLETALIQGGSKANGALRTLVQTATGAINTFADLPGPMQATAVGIVAIGSAGAGALAFFGSVAPKIKAARVELAQMGSAGARANTVIGGIGRAGAVAGTALVSIEALSLGVGKLQDALVHTGPGVNELTASLLKARSWDDVSKTLGGDFEDLGLKIRHISDPSTTQQINNLFAGVIGQAPKSLREAKNEVGSLDDALTQLVQQGQGAEAARQFQLIAQAALAGGASVDQVRAAMPKYRDALAAVKNESTLTAGAQSKQKNSTDEVNSSTKGYTGTVRDATGSLHRYESAADAVKASIDALNGTTIAAAEADIDYRNAVARATGSIKENGRTLDLNTQKGRDNRSAIINAIKAANQHAQAVADQTHNTGKGTAAFAANVEQLRRVLRQSGLTKKQVDGLINTYARVPKNITTKVTAAVSVVDAIAAHVVTPNRTGRLATSNQGGLATGGWVPGYSPSDTADNIPATIGGQRPLWLTGEEFVINRPRAREIRRRQPGLLEAINAGQVDVGGDTAGMMVRYGKALKFAGGGSIPAVQRFMRSTDPLPYIWGAVGPNAYDCSGLAGEVYNRLTGRPSWRRSFTTASNFAALGFRRGLGTFTIGLNPGHHMDANLAGYQAEARSTATGIFTGAAATPVTRFAQQWYLPQIGGRFVAQGGSLDLTNRQKAQIFAMIRPQITRMVMAELSGRAGGGPVEAGQLYKVNERGQEGFFAPPVNGSILPAHAMSARGITPAGTDSRSLLAALGRLEKALAARAPAPLVQVEKMELRDPVDVDLLAHRLAFLDATAAGGFS